MDFTINIRTRFIVKSLAYFAIGLLLAGVISHSLKYDFDRLPALYRWLNTDGEKNFPAAFSSGLLSICSVLTLLIAVHKSLIKDRFTLYWGGLSLLFAALAADEWLSFHEQMSDVIRPLLPVSGIFHFAWILAGMAFLAVVGLIYWRFLINLPPRYRRWFVLSAVVFVTGAIGMEMLGGYYADTHQQWNRNIWLGLTTVEEGLEMFGVIIFIRALLSYIQDFVGEVTLCLNPPALNSPVRSRYSEMSANAGPVGYKKPDQAS